MIEQLDGPGGLPYCSTHSGCNNIASWLQVSLKFRSSISSSDESGFLSMSPSTYARSSSSGINAPASSLNAPSTLSTGAKHRCIGSDTFGQWKPWCLRNLFQPHEALPPTSLPFTSCLLPYRGNPERNPGINDSLHRLWCFQSLFRKYLSGHTQDNL